MKLLTSIVLLFSITGYGQRTDSILHVMNYRQIDLREKNDTIHFLVKGLIDTKIKKPVLLFCQGSGSSPLVTVTPEGNYQVFPFDVKPYLDKYYFVIIAKPGVPPVSSQLDRGFNYIEDTVTKAFPKKFTDNDNLDYYAWQTDKVINYLVKQGWVDKKKIVVAGHSQGYRVAARAALLNKNVTHLICTSSNPLGLLYWSVSGQTEMAIKGRIPMDVALKNINDLYAGLKDLMMNDRKEMKVPLLGYTSYKNFMSWMPPSKDDLLQLTIPIFVAYGTDDYGRISNDILPLEFYLRKKFNLTLKAYKNCDHFFTERVYDDKGNVIKTIEHFDELAKEFFDWIEQSHDQEITPGK
jgi:pimeloyl-ACP methyl ester carboxylesterase